MKKFLMVLLLIVVGLVLFVQSRPGTYHVERSAVVAAPAEVAFAQVNDFHAWPAWSPWQKLDPQMKITYGGAESGVGATYHWEGNDKVGVGEMSITESTPVSLVGMKLDFIKPFASTCSVTFTFTPGEPGTEVRWAMDGKANFMSKAMCLITPMDKMIGPDFERGLANLKSVAEEAAQVSAAADSAAAAAAAAKPAAGKTAR